MQVVSVNISSKKGTVKHPVREAVIDRHGVVGDAHAGPWHRQVSLLSVEIISEFEKEIGRKIAVGEFAENITVSGIDLRKVAPLDRFLIGDIELEVTQIGKACHGAACAIFKEVGKCAMPEEGIFCRVLKGGRISAGMPAKHVERKLLILLITMSDRASRGEYEDRSGPRMRQLLEQFFSSRRWHPRIDAEIQEDSADLLENRLKRAKQEGIDAVFTTGGTGVGPRDITPDVVAALADRQIPGIMEHIRSKYAGTNANALLSRGIVGIIGNMLVYTLPGSVRAVDEYLGEIFKTLEHVILMIHSIDSHSHAPSSRSARDTARLPG